MTAREDRMASFRKLQEVIPDVTCVKAVDASRFTQEIIDLLVLSGFLHPNSDGTLTDAVVAGRVIQPGEIGCFLSHRKALKAIESQEKDWGIIFEDDVELINGFHQILEKILPTLDSISDFDIAHMYVFPNQRKYFDAVTHDPSFVVTPQGLWGAQMYLVPKSKANKILTAVSSMYAAYDEMLTRSNLNSYTLINVNLVNCRDIPSSIQIDYSKQPAVNEAQEGQRSECTFSDREPEGMTRSSTHHSCRHPYRSSNTTTQESYTPPDCAGEGSASAALQDSSSLMGAGDQFL
jgi:GR25 family glycosyltransferase involved in LPS biosynthesis